MSNQLHAWSVAVQAFRDCCVTDLGAIKFEANPGHARVTLVDRTAGTVTVSTFGDALKDLYRADRIMAMTDTNHVFLDMIAVGDPALTQLECGIAAAVALGGLGWIIARRNALAGAEEAVSESWLRAVADWLIALVRGLLAAGPAQLPPHEASP